MDRESRESYRAFLRTRVATSAFDPASGLAMLELSEKET